MRYPKNQLIGLLMSGIVIHPFIETPQGNI